jgi:hypothetical protein
MFWVKIALWFRPLSWGLGVREGMGWRWEKQLPQGLSKVYECVFQVRVGRAHVLTQKQRTGFGFLTGLPYLSATADMSSWGKGSHAPGWVTALWQVPNDALQKSRTDCQTMGLSKGEEQSYGWPNTPWRFWNPWTMKKSQVDPSSLSFLIRLRHLMNKIVTAVSYLPGESLST